MTASILPIHIISLPLSVRRSGIAEILNSRGVHYQFFDATDVRMLDEHQFNQFYDDKRARIRYGRALSRGEVGCLLSHRALWEYIALSGRGAIVLEDDAILDERFFSDILTASEIALSSTADIILLGRSKLSRSREWLTYLYDPLKYVRQVGNLRVGVPFKQSTSGAVGYWISAKGAAKAFERTVGRVNILADDWLSFRESAGIQIAELRPYVVWEAYESMPSTIESGRADLSMRRSLFYEGLLKPIRLIRAGIRWIVIAVIFATASRKKLFPQHE